MPMNRPQSFGAHLPRGPHQPMLLDISTAKPGGEIDWDGIAAKTRGGTADPSKKSYDTSKYLAQLREEDPWPEAAPAK